MNNIIRDFPNRYTAKISMAIMLDDVISKMLYYNNVLNEDIYSLPSVDNPIKELRDNNVFIDRKVSKILRESDSSIFININSDKPYTKSGQPSSRFKTLEIEVGVICHNACRFTINGSREAIIFNRILQVIQENESLKEGIIGDKIGLGSVNEIRNMPEGYVGYSITISVEYWNK